MVRQWDRRHWGEGGEEFHWWCTEDPAAFVGHAAGLPEHEVPNSRRWPATKVYKRLAAYLDGRRTARRARGRLPPPSRPSGPELTTRPAGSSSAEVSASFGVRSRGSRRSRPRWPGTTRRACHPVPPRIRDSADWPSRPTASGCALLRSGDGVPSSTETTPCPTRGGTVPRPRQTDWGDHQSPMPCQCSARLPSVVAHRVGPGTIAGHARPIRSRRPWWNGSGPGPYAVRSRGLPPVEGPDRERFKQQARRPTSWTSRSSATPTPPSRTAILTLRIDLRPAAPDRPLRTGTRHGTDLSRGLIRRSSSGCPPCAGHPVPSLTGSAGSSAGERSRAPHRRRPPRR